MLAAASLGRDLKRSGCHLVQTPVLRVLLSQGHGVKQKGTRGFGRAALAAVTAGLGPSSCWRPDLACRGAFSSAEDKEPPCSLGCGLSPHPGTRPLDLAPVPSPEPFPCEALELGGWAAPALLSPLG